MEPLLTIPEAAARYGVKIRSIKHWLAQKELAKVTLGRSVYLRPETLEEFFKKHES